MSQRKIQHRSFSGTDHCEIISRKKLNLIQENIHQQILKADFEVTLKKIVFFNSTSNQFQH